MDVNIINNIESLMYQGICPENKELAKELYKLKEKLEIESIDIDSEFMIDLTDMWDLI